MSKSYRIVETDNHGGDYPNERFVTLPLLSEKHARKIANVSGYASRFWQVVEDGYVLQPGFEP